MHNDYIKQLRECVTECDVRELFKNKNFPNAGKLKFSDKYLSLIGSGNILTNFEVKISGVGELALKVVFYLKLDGYLNNIPQNSGQTAYFNSFHSIMRAILQKKKKNQKLKRDKFWRY
jgi:hypothetical protein